jgi:hypothetical protein
MKQTSNYTPHTNVSKIILAKIKRHILNVHGSTSEILVAAFLQLVAKLIQKFRSIDNHQQHYLHTKTY